MSKKTNDSPKTNSPNKGHVKLNVPVNKNPPPPPKPKPSSNSKKD